MFKYIDHVAVHCSDLGRSERFYAEAFGFEAFSHHERPGGGIVYMRLGDSVLELTEKPKEPMSGMHFAVETDDMEAAVRHLAAVGAEMIQEPRPLRAKRPGEGETRRAVYCGPDGEMIEVRGT
ncbi:MAG TPA: VOC family protein [Alphaproteobacteria bacterium]|jgi:catechol 2,3-dioxygenase-like lactoylglutathione lyase family enzyme